MDKLLLKVLVGQKRLFSLLNGVSGISAQLSNSKFTYQPTQRYFLSYSSQVHSKESVGATTTQSQFEQQNGKPPTGDEIKVSESCAKRLTELLNPKITNELKFLRVSVEGGGCSGFQYKFEIDSKFQPDDKTFVHPTYDSVFVVVDSTSLEYLKGSVVDYQNELIRSAFRVVQNPKADHGCSCGASFTIKVD